MTKVLMIAAGGAVGSTFRYFVAGWGQRVTAGPFPVGTLTVNVVGCFLIGALGALFAGPVLVRDEYRLALLVGALGGFTTFSSYGWETLALLNDAQYGRALLNVLSNNLLGLAAVWAGYRAVEWVWGV